MENKNVIVPVRGFFRVVGISICLISFYIILFDRTRSLSFLISTLVFTPLVFVSCILGRMPFCMTKYIPDHDLNILYESEKVFHGRSVNSFIAIIVFMAVAIFLMV